MLDGKLLEFSNQNKQHAQEIVDFTKEVDRLSEFKEIEKAFRLIEQFKVGYEFDLEKIKPQVNAIQFEHAQDIFFANKKLFEKANEIMSRIHYCKQKNFEIYFIECQKNDPIFRIEIGKHFGSMVDKKGEYPDFENFWKFWCAAILFYQNNSFFYFIDEKNNLKRLKKFNKMVAFNWISSEQEMTINFTIACGLRSENPKSVREETDKVNRYILENTANGIPEIAYPTKKEYESGFSPNT